MEEKMQNNSKPSSEQDAEAESKDVPNMEEKMQNISKPSSGQDAEAKSKDIGSFRNSLQELRDLRSQLHYAADYCESTFLNTKEKKVVMENTKEYICRAVVTVVDHLGCVSANLNGIVSETNAFSEAEIRIDCLKQRMFLCEQYTHKFALPRVRWREIIPRHNARFLSAATREAEKPNEDSRDIPRNPASHKTTDKQESDRDVAMPLFLSTSSHKPSLSKGENNSALVPVHDGLSILSRGPNLTFHFQESRKINGRLKKSGHGNDILSLIRRAKRRV
ncbi:protein ABIL5 [Pyrus ussuriensis x Pyrus communis]|uniref:Protein ABIL5 n=1 Tax=Pyrus ussuriensis x Pyrus communis TaxID=2448454 RepID=A0A5N5GT05_9ROSA|nr:protein ABIL5 [Pyrus ussuriensis x Pyrus communis]